MQGRRFRQQEGRIMGIVIMAVFLYCLFPGLLYAQQHRIFHDLFSVSFPTDKDGWTCGRWGTILRTTDGGATWAREKSGTDYTLTSIFFVDPMHGWAVGNGGTILSTKDGGTTWTKQESHVPFFLMGVHFATPQKGWIVGERTHILYTADGGKTWQVQFKDEDYILKSVSFCDEKNGWAVGEYGLIYHTTDGGATWRKQAGGFGISRETGELLGGNILFNVIAINPKTAWAVGIDGYVTKTTDGGTTWTQIEKGVPKSHLLGVTSSGGTFVMGGTALLVISTDGGASFKAPTTIEPPVTYGYVYGITPRGNKGFVAVGKEGWIYVSDPKGTAWQKVTY